MTDRDRLKAHLDAQKCKPCTGTGRVMGDGAGESQCGQCRGSGHMSVNQYARTVLVRDPRQVQRMLAGTVPIPNAIVAWLDTHEAT